MHIYTEKLSYHTIFVLFYFMHKYFLCIICKSIFGNFMGSRKFWVGKSIKCWYQFRRSDNSVKNDCLYFVSKDLSALEMRYFVITVFFWYRISFFLHFCVQFVQHKLRFRRIFFLPTKFCSQALVQFNPICEKTPKKTWKLYEIQDYFKSLPCYIFNTFFLRI